LAVEHSAAIKSHTLWLSGLIRLLAKQIIEMKFDSYKVTNLFYRIKSTFSTVDIKSTVKVTFVDMLEHQQFICTSKIENAIDLS
jgi:hypothetical protein